MRVMVLVKATADSEKGFVHSAWSQAMLEAMDAFNAALAEAGVLLAAAGLKPTSQAWRIAFDGDLRSERQGPFLPAQEQVAGYWLWQVKDMEEALAWARRCPQPMPGACEIEVRPLFEAADLA